MSEKRYILSFYDKTSKVVSEAEAARIMQFVEEGRSHFRLKEEMYACAGISKIIKLKASTENVDDGSYNQKLLEPPHNPVKKETILALKNSLK